MPDYKGFKEQSQIIRQFFEKEQFADARIFILELLDKDADSHWLLAQLSETYYEERNYEKALEYIIQAKKIAPHCPLVLWDYAGTLDMLERNEESLRVYKSLLRRGIYRIAYEECGEGIRAARRMINDCRYRLGLLYADIGKFNLAKKYIKEYIANRSRKTPSTYNLSEVKKQLALILEGKNPRST